jgi:diguanylate cyclase (GGDEF)-like protein
LALGRIKWKNLFRILDWKQVVVCTLLCLVLLALILLNLYELMTLGQENTYRNCQNNYLVASREIGDFLRVADESIEFSSQRIEEMLAGGATHEEILAYMTRESANLNSRIAGPTTGVYGYIDGVYLDGTGWEPIEGYEPMKRPWYIGAVAAGGEVTHVPPFMNFQTGSTTITVCKVLSDGVDVVAMDLPTDKLQAVVDGIAEQDSFYKSGGESPYSYAQILVLDSDGVVIAHTDTTQVGMNYAASEDPVAREIARQAFANDETLFRVEGEDAVIYCSGKLDGKWCILSGLEYSKVMSRITRNIVISTVVSILGILGMVTVMARLAIRRYLAETDRMTGINNRSGEEKVSRLLRAGQEGLFLLIDVDKFKSINDTFGHDVGDKALIAVAGALKAAFGKKNLIMRLGGDEFAAFAVGVTGEPEASEVVRRLFDEIDAIAVPEMGKRKLAVSVGAAFYHSGDDISFSTLYKRADKGTYESKKIVGNHVTYYSA